MGKYRIQTAEGQAEVKTALITTTINVPRVLALYRKLGPDVRFFVAGDEKTPHQDVGDFLETLGRKGDVQDDPCEQYYHPEDQRGLNYKCSELIGWNCVERRNIALLEAVKWDADVIVTIDDDNIPIGTTFGSVQHMLLKANYTYEKDYPPEYEGERNFSWKIEGPKLFNGLEATSPSGWYDPGDLLIPHVKHRGFPIQVKPEPVYQPVVDARIGVAQGLCLGDPDIDAVTRIATAPIVHSVSELGRAGIVVDPRKTRTVFNTQNTAFIRELAPAFFQPPGVGRYSDIYASLICQRVMSNTGLHVHFGQPFVWQQRNQHNLIADLRAEIDGMDLVRAFAYRLGCMSNLEGSILEQTRRLYQNLLEFPFATLPEKSVEAALAFLDDIEGVM